MDPHPTRSARYQQQSYMSHTSEHSNSLPSYYNRHFSTSSTGYHTFANKTSCMNSEANREGPSSSAPAAQSAPPIPTHPSSHPPSQQHQQHQQQQQQQQQQQHSEEHLSDGNPTSDPAVDMEQHCLLFPTYATTHSRSGSKDPLDWNIRVRGWAFSKRSNRRKRLVMSMARKLAGVTKDNKVYDTLESRFGMFLASNTQGAWFSIQCVGVAETTQMELAGDPSSHDPTVNVLMNELNTPEGARAAEEAVMDKARLRKSLEEDNRGEILRMNNIHPSTSPRSKSKQILVDAIEAHRRWQRQMSQESQHSVQSQKNHQEDQGSQSKYFPEDGVPLSKVMSPEAEAPLTDRWSKGAAFVKGAIRKYKPVVMAQINGSTSTGTGTSTSTSSSNSSVDSFRTHSEQRQARSGGSLSLDGTVTSHPRYEHTSGPQAQPASNRPPGVTRSDSGDSVISQTQTHYEDLGHGMFPTVQLASKPGGHFDGTLRVSLADMNQHGQHDQPGGVGHPRFLKLHAYNPDMTDHCHGIVNLIDPEGISIISDIDDTIKETNVSAGARIILRNTFLKDMRDVPGMAAVYNRWWKRGAAIHYVSNSPWQLIPSLLDFFHMHKFPPGSAHLRLHDSVLRTYFMAPGENKRRCIREILTDFPHRKFIFVGDSGEIDMEIYTEMAIAFPNQVFKIFIRDISTARLKEEAMKAATAPPRASSFTSMLPRAPINAVTSGFAFFSRSGASTNTDDSSVNKQSGHVGSVPEEEKGTELQDVQTLDELHNMNKDLESLSTTGQKSSHDHQQHQWQRGDTTRSPVSDKNDQSQVRPRAPTADGDTEAPLIDFSSADDSAMQGSTKMATIASESANAVNEASANAQRPLESSNISPTPGALPPSSSQTGPPVAKTPYELWLERIEACEKKLPSGMLTLFETTDVLEQDILVDALFEKYGTTPGHEDRQDEEKGKEDDHHHLHLHHLHHHRQQQYQQSQQRRQDGGDRDT
ncbi:hypothetical protein BGZ94_000902 [Podila epigama]|nr:hypothetical protein BGZ94_000902 [Podila epigama]